MAYYLSTAVGITIFVTLLVFPVTAEDELRKTLIRSIEHVSFDPLIVSVRRRLTCIHRSSRLSVC